MADDTRDVKTEEVDVALDGMKIEEESSNGLDHNITLNGQHDQRLTLDSIKRSDSSTSNSTRSKSQSPMKHHSATGTPQAEDEEEKIAGDISVIVQPGKMPKLSRKASQKVISRPAPLFDHLEDSTPNATQLFQVIRDCIYGSKYMGYSEHDALDCDCSEEWKDGQNHACGEDSDCINRATKMECVDGDCNCGAGCQNQRFQRKEYADVSVIKTEKKGYGLRVNVDLHPNDFIFEYIGEVINEPTFRRRTIQYDEEGIKHFYFMSLTKSEFVDATKKGNLGRFCNHSCNPNCYVDKWVVGEKLRMGIFAERHIKAGEELVFNYNVDRYGADPQPCYCDEPNCTGYIGGKTQTERATKLSHATIEALGIDDGDGWDTAVARKPRKKKTGENDEEYVNNVQARGLDEDGVRKVMATLMQCKEKWIAVKLLSRIQRCDDDKVRNRVVQMHGYQILRTTLNTWKEDNNVILQILDILYAFPRLTRNKIVDSKIEGVIEGLATSEHEDVAFESKRLLEEWSKLEVAYRIPRKKFDPSAVSVFERRNIDRDEETPSTTTSKIVAPTGPKNSIPQRTLPFASRPPVRRPFHPLPAGWFTALDEKGNSYYYSKSGQTTWSRPYLPATEPPPPPKLPPKSVQTQRALQDIIDSITKQPEPSSSHTPSRNGLTADSTPTKDKKKSGEKWRSLPIEKRMKLYENTLFPHIKHVMQKYSKQLPKEDLKKFAKEVGKKLVASDFNHGRVDDPTRISEKQEKKVKKYVRDFFEKAVEKKKVLDRRKADKARVNGTDGDRNGDLTRDGCGPDQVEVPDELAPTADSDVDMSDDEPERDEPILTAHSDPETPSFTGSSERKRKRDVDDGACDGADTSTPGDGDDDRDSSKRVKEDETADVMPPPPPPPPPLPAAGMPEISGVDDDGDGGGELELELDDLEDRGSMDAQMPGGREVGTKEMLRRPETDEERELRRQEEELMRENEEALALEMENKMEEQKVRELELERERGARQGRDINREREVVVVVG